MVGCVVKTLNIPIFEVEGFEADDVIGTLAKQANSKKIQVVIVTGDQDAMQLVNGNVRVFVPGRGWASEGGKGQEEVSGAAPAKRAMGKSTV